MNFRLRAGGNDLALQRHIGDHDHVGGLGALDLHLGIGVLGVGLERVPRIHQGLGAGVQDLVRHAQGFQQNNVHPGSILLSFTRCKFHTLKCSFIISPFLPLDKPFFPQRQRFPEENAPCSSAPSRRGRTRADKNQNGLQDQVPAAAAQAAPLPVAADVVLPEKGQQNRDAGEQDDQRQSGRPVEGGNARRIGAAPPDRPRPGPRRYRTPPGRASCPGAVPRAPPPWAAVRRPQAGAQGRSGTARRAASVPAPVKSRFRSSRAASHLRPRFSSG